MIFFSDTTWRMELKTVMIDHCKLLTKCCYFLDRLKIQDGHQRGTLFNIATLWEICKTNFFSRTTGWIGTILGRNVPDKVLINCCYFLFRSVIQYGCQGPSQPLIGWNFKDLLLRYYMEDGIENCQEWSLQAVNQVLLLFGTIENPRWPPAGDII